MEALEILLGLALIGAVLWDVFQSIVVPRPSPTRYRISRLVVRRTWHLTRWYATRPRAGGPREGMLGIFAPAAVFMLLASWIAILLLGDGLLIYGLRDQMRPVPANLGEAIYAAGTSLFTIGFGDFVPVGGAARFVMLASAATGLGVVALVITYLFSLYGAFQRREVLVVTLDSRAGAPPSGIALLETYSHYNMVPELPALFAAWEVWAAEVLDSHVAYPILAYFRSSHDHESWVSSLGAVLDAATLVLTTIEGVPRGQAKMMFAMGEHLVEDVAPALRLPRARRSRRRAGRVRPGLRSTHGGGLHAHPGRPRLAGVQRRPVPLRQSPQPARRLLCLAAKPVDRGPLAEPPFLRADSRSRDGTHG